MSKSKKNVVDPEDILSTYGADAARLFILSDSPPERDLEWTESGIEGAWRFINRLYRLVTEIIEDCPPQQISNEKNFTPAGKALQKKSYATQSNVDAEIDKFQMNKAVARLREFTNDIESLKPANDDEKQLRREMAEVLVQYFNPIIPHVTEELWEQLGYPVPLAAESTWPSIDPALLVADSVTIGVQVNGKLRGQITIPANSNEDTARETALSEPGVKKALEGLSVRKVIVVPNRIVNVVAG